jgi:nucleoside-diphosphate-sugar epimerase
VRIGISGVAGFIGSNLADALVDRSFTYISDLVDGIVRAAEYQA